MKGLGYDPCEAEKKEAGANIVAVVVVVCRCCRSIPRSPDPSLLDGATHPRGLALSLSLFVLVTGYEGIWCRRGQGAAAGRCPHPRPSLIGSTGFLPC
jgi:hypothetical protein